MVVLRENSLRIQFARTDKQPSSYELYRFIIDSLQLKMDSVCGLQMDNQACSVILKLSLASRFNNVLDICGNSVPFKYESGLITQVKVVDANISTRTVKVSHLPFELSDSDIRSFFESYGKVQEIIRETWQDEYLGNLETGTRCLLMELKTPIPTKVIINGNQGFVSYAGQPKTCHYCHAVGHLIAECPKKKTPPRTPIKSTNEWPVKKLETRHIPPPVIASPDGQQIQLTKLVKAIQPESSPVLKSNDQNIKEIASNSYNRADSESLSTCDNQSEVMDHDGFQVVKRKSRSNSPVDTKTAKKLPKNISGV